MVQRLWLRMVLLVCISLVVSADEHDHEYEPREEVVLWFNTVGPYHNRQETYRYFTLPFCRGKKESFSHHHETIGEALQGVELDFSGLEINFGEDVPDTVYCSVQLDESKFKALHYAVKHHYWYQMYLDDLPMWALVGDFGEGETEHERENGDLFVWTHKRFDIGFNGNQIVDSNLTTGRRVKLAPGVTLDFSYQVIWHKSSVEFSKRFEKYLDPTFFQHRIHWFSIFNSFMMVVFLVGLVGMILMKTLRKDYARYSKDDELDDLERDLGDEYGWKQVHGDVFRPPQYPLLFASLLGTGYQVATVSLCVICFAIMGSLYFGRGSILTTLIFVYAATAPVAGYFGGSIYF
jgi:transmembrane 9 superfamily protein 3